jgi:hypothetical protein
VATPLFSRYAQAARALNDVDGLARRSPHVFILTLSLCERDAERPITTTTHADHEVAENTLDDAAADKRFQVARVRLRTPGR